ncbi:hypothetical protein PIB30_038250 [Stylosanthes scabra]|uniref:Uncharacterized protein n=1 Tax=Stylosanthes scabra TaxID=79078 RepID=A0ABU6VGU6_9FABA|nr:hypothetical protein [Stylosanthes scabra]
MALNDHLFLTVDAVSLYKLVTGSSLLIAPSMSKAGLYMTTYLGLEVVAVVIPRAGNLRFSPLSSHLTQDILFPSVFLTMSPKFAGPSAPRSLRPAGSPSSSASFGLSDGVPREREHSARSLVPTPVYVPVYPPPLMPMMDARRYRSLFGKCRVVPPTPPPSNDESSDEDDDEHDDSNSDSDTSLSSKDVSSSDTSKGAERESTSFSSGPSNHSSSGNSSSNSSFGYCSGSNASSNDAYSEDNLVDHYFAGVFPPSMP